MATYILTTWVPSFYGPRSGYSPKGEEQRRAINAPNDKIAIKQLRKILPETGRSVVGTLTTQNGRLVARCYTIHTMSKVAWDDPPKYMDISYRTFLAQSDEEAKKQLPADDYDAGGGWKQDCLYGPDGYTPNGVVHIATGIPHGTQYLMSKERRT